MPIENRQVSTIHNNEEPNVGEKYAIWHSRTPHMQSIKRWIITIAHIQICHHVSKSGVKTADLEV